MKPTHTPTAAPSSTPWRVVNEGFKHGYAAIETEDGGYEVVLSCRRDNAAFIVRAVNSHQALIDALEHALLWCPSNHPDAEMYRNTLKTAKGE